VFIFEQNVKRFLFWSLLAMAAFAAEDRFLETLLPARKA